jgi:hypothetical protein
VLVGAADNGRANWKNTAGLSINDLEQLAMAQAEDPAGVNDTVTIPSDMSAPAELEPVETVVPKQDKLFYTRAGCAAAGFWEPQKGMLVLKGSKGSPTLKTSGNGALREKLKSDGVIALDEKQMIFLKDHLFATPSAAGSALAGAADNGRANWKNAAGLSINDLKQLALAEAAGDDVHADP